MPSYSSSLALKPRMVLEFKRYVDACENFYQRKLRNDELTH
jgi:hypothetical protein